MTTPMNTKIYATREDYAREVWAGFHILTQREILADYGMTDATDEFFAYFTDNMDARNNGAVTFTRVEGGYTVEDEAAL